LETKRKRRSYKMTSVKVYDVAYLLPKTELHLHLDGSLSPSFMKKRAALKGIELPDDVRTYMHDLKKNQVQTAAANSNWGIFDFCNQFLQTEADLEEATYCLCEELSSLNVFYAEIRFCPTLHTLQGLTEEQVLIAVLKGIRKGIEEKKIEGGGIIIGALRSKVAPFDPDHSIRLVKLAHKYLDQGVVAFDICGDEASFPLSLHFESLEYAKKNGIKLAVHAGEWTTTSYDHQGGSISNLRYLIEHGAHRIGHGIALRQDPELLQAASKKGIFVECCIVSNVGSGKVPSYDNHPIKDMFSAGVRVTLNSDNLLLSGNHTQVANSVNEICRLMEDAGFNYQDLKTVLLNGAEGAINMTPSLKKLYKERIDAVYQQFGLE